MNWKKFANDIDAHRYALGSYSDCERHSGISSSIIHRAASGVPVDVNSFERLCVWADLNPLEYLLGGQKWKK